jgi:hypothetical protein
MAWRTCRRAASLAAVTVVALTLAACGGGDDDDSASAKPDTEVGSASEDTDTTATTADPEAEVLEGYKAARSAIYGAYDPPDPQDPELVALVDGEALSSAQYTLGRLQVDGVSYTGPFELHPTLVSQDGDNATVEDCVTEQTQEVNLSTGQASGPPADQTNHDRIDLQRIGGVWKIVKIEELGEECTP